jgi:Family of unknown function (DUF6155)
MPITTTTLKKYLTTLTEAELREELLKLFSKLDQVKSYYAQELATKEDRTNMLQAYKKRLYSQVYTPKGNPKNINNAAMKLIIAEFEKISVFPHELVDLILYRVELTTEYANAFGGALDSEYNAAVTAFKKAVKLIRVHKLKSTFDARIQKIFEADNLDFWYIDFLMEEYEE